MSGPTRAEVLAVPHRDADTEIRALLQAAEDAETRCPECGQPATITAGGLYERHQPDQHPVFSKRCKLGGKPAR